MAGENDSPTPPDAAETKPTQPASPSKRKLLGAFGVVAGAFGLAWGAKKVAQTETAQRIIQTAPGQDYSDLRPSLYTQQKEVEHNLDAIDPSKRGKIEVSEEQKAIEDRIKAENDANPANRWVKPTPTTKK
jgi:hypothetical protein